MDEPSGLPALTAKTLKAIGPLHRTLAVEIDGERMAARAQGDERVPLVLSTETPAYQAELGGMEVLDHSESSIDLSRLSRGIPLMAVMRGMGLDHGYKGDAVQVGVVDEPSLGADRKLRAWGRFGRSATAQEVKQDVMDGIRQYVSPGYRITRMRREKGPDGVQQYRATRWMPFEVTFVPAPADMEAGVGRSADGDARPVEIENPEPITAPSKAKENTVSDTPAASENNGAGRIEVRSLDDGKMKNVAELASMMKMEGVFAAGVGAGKDADSIQADIRAEHKRRLAAGEQAIQNGGAGGLVKLTEREEKQYSLTRAILAAGGDKDAEAGFEMEVSDEIGRKLGKQSSKGFYFATNVRSYGHTGMDPMSPRYGQRAGLYNAATVGAETVFDVPGSFIDLLRNKARVLQAGATMMSGLQGPVTFPKQTAPGVGYWMSENGGTDATESNIVLGTVTLVPTTLQSTSSFSRQLLRQSILDVEGLVRSDLASIHALAIDLAALNGSGSAPTPLGIIPDTNCNTVALGTDGAAPTYTAMVQMEEEVEKDNADTGTGAYITTPSVKRKLKTTQIFTSEGVAVWSGGPTGQVNGYAAYSTNQTPSNLTKGTSTTVCHGIVFGHWANLLIGEWGAMEIIVDPFRLKKQGMIEITSFQMVDIDKKYAQAFCVISDAKP